MNAVVQFQPQQAVVPNFTIADMERVALAIAKGGLFGSSDPNAVLTLCMLAQAEGQHPAVVFRDYHIIQGKPAKKAEAMHRDFLAAGGKIEWHRCDDECADATFSHPQGGSMRISWDNERVQQAQLGGNPMHKKYPRAMKRSRVISEGVRAVFPMATSGLYETGEVQDMVAQDGPPAPAMPEPKRARDIAREKPQAIADGTAAPTPPDAARKWADAYVAAVAKATDADDLAIFANSKAARLAELESKRPELHAECIHALDLRRKELADFPLTEDNPAAAEGRADEDFGDQFDDADA